MDQVEIDVLRLEPGEAGSQRLLGLLEAMVAVGAFGGDEDVLGPTRDTAGVWSIS
jgi:hypothetical protein